jgi:type III secretion system YscQ/HrcQ family protein
MLRPFANLSVLLTGRLGLATLEADELARLEPTDILLFETEELTVGSAPTNELGGSIELAHFGWDRSLGAIRGTLQDDGRQLRFQVEEHILPARYATQEANLNNPPIPPSSGDPEDTAINADSTAPGSPVSGQKLVEGSPIQLRVEIGRLKMTLRELSEIGAGQILNLHRAPTDPVTLVVDDRVIGRGELVQVEGELGVRVSSLGTS